MEEEFFEASVAGNVPTAVFIKMLNMGGVSDAKVEVELL
jgi:hypothetical protein